jgi:MoaA/NifB/PqqE/SkfB family radical SAM enzyme
MNNLQEFVLELTDSCPLLCRHCSSMSGPHRRDHLLRGHVPRLIEEARALGVKQISFGGGEPTSSPLFLEVLNATVAAQMASEVYTSGVMRAGSRIIPLHQEFFESVSNLSPLKFIFSFHGSRADLHDYITGSPGSFVSLVCSVERCIEAGINCEINFVPLRSNASCFPDIMKLAIAFGMRRVNVLRFVPQGRGFRNRAELEMTAAEEAAFIRKLLCIRGESNIEIRTGSPFNGMVPGPSVPCRAGWAKLVIQANGNVLPCEVFKHHEKCNWGLSVYELSLTQMLQSPQLISLQSLLDKTDRIECPVHKMSKSHKHSEAYCDLPKSSVYFR